MHEFDATFRFRGKFGIRFDGVIECGGVRIETKDGEICEKTTISIERNDPYLARESAIKRLEELASILTLIFGEGFAVEDVNVEHKPIIEVEGRSKKVSLCETVRAKDRVSRMYLKESLNEIKAKLEELTGKIDSFEKKRREDLLRAIKWWRRGNLEEDNVDKFLDYFISFEMLASMKGYKSKRSKYRDKWAMKFSEDYSITYKPGGKMTVKEIRNNIMHEPGPEKEEAEKLANEYADAFGREILNAIKKIIDEGLS
jgi:uncharacterized protein YnzC (UPF0291/DUF896 family)